MLAEIARLLARGYLRMLSESDQNPLADLPQPEAPCDRTVNSREEDAA